MRKTLSSLGSVVELFEDLGPFWGIVIVVACLTLAFFLMKWTRGRTANQKTGAEEEKNRKRS